MIQAMNHSRKSTLLPEVPRRLVLVLVLAVRRTNADEVLHPDVACEEKAVQDSYQASAWATIVDVGDGRCTPKEILHGPCKIPAQIVSVFNLIARKM